MKHYMEFINTTAGKKYDLDGYYGAQCWDGFAYYLSLQGYPIINCTTSGYVKDIANNKNSNGILNNFFDLTGKTMKSGTWAVFGNNNETPDSHVAMFVADCGNGVGKFWGQNQNGHPEFTYGYFHYSGIIGAFHDRAFKDDVIISNGGKAIAKYDSIRIRTQPNLLHDSIVRNEQGEELWYNTGMELNYRNVIKSDGYIWLEYVRSSGGIGYVAYQQEGAIDTLWNIIA